MIERLDPKEFDAVFDLMERSFPKEEYRPYAGQEALLSDPAYAIYTAKEGGSILGFAVVWELEDILFLEHLAVAPEHRNSGIGSQLLEYIRGSAKRVCLEVEPPETELTRRRVGFYERNGFFFNDYPYEQPFLGQGTGPIPLRIMTTGGTITPATFARIRELLYSRVYGKKAGKAGAKLYMLSSTTDTINTAFVLQSGDAVMVVDGGFSHEAEHLHRVLRQVGGKVDAWFLTHAHEDHISALFTVLQQYEDIRVEKVYYNFPSDDFLCSHLLQQQTLTTRELLDTLRSTLQEYAVPTVTVETGDCYGFDGFCVRVLRTPDETITNNAVNNSSCVYRVELNETGESILFLGDLGVEGGLQLLEITPAEWIRADYVQMAHHGQLGVSREVYEAVRPRFCLWCTPSWLWDNMGIHGYDTGRYQTVVVRGWMSSLGTVERHYLMTDGDQIIEL